MDELLASELLGPRATSYPSLAEQGARADVLHRLVGDWQLLADLSFADLVLYVPDVTGEKFVVVAQMRPTTGPTAYQDDLVGNVVVAAEHPQLAIALGEGRIVREGDPVWVAGTPVREEALPVRVGGRIVAVVARATNLAAARTPSQLEIAYLRSANDLAQMLAEGGWPYPGEPSPEGGPRVGDGLIRLDPEGVATFASPNALSAYRRLGHVGDLAGSSLAEITATLAGRSVPAIGEPVAVIARGRTPGIGDLQVGDVVVQLRALPLRPGREHIGAVVLVHDVTELRRRERALITKDATIREIHHRVKNNLQTVAALLRLQARRMAVDEAREALEESVRRVSSIALVHETLSGTLDEAMSFDEVADRVLTMVAEVTDTAVSIRRVGSFGVLSADVATPLAMALSELVHNAVEHGYDEGGTGEVRVIITAPSEERLRVEVVDDGHGLPEGFDMTRSERLGLQIVNALVEGELGGRLSLTPAPGRGTIATVDLSAAP
ncbi:MAG: histidine kinase N-terminal domain-containing protein [Frankiaceae bacterium]|nr:histidine kinase N-terminal domain-containing protein [Frankiaceae bacterium]MBV9872747.1 histidine kinase N-terminal domain-containing protein [Frankiaceae bacterium]